MKDKKLSLEETLVEGSHKKFTTSPSDTSKPLVVRGVIKKHHVDKCVDIGRDFYYIDTGYLGNFPSHGNPGGKKVYHRVVKNENQHTIIRNVPSDRWEKLIEKDPRYKWDGWKHYDKKILLIMPNPKACKYYNVDYDTWVKETKEKISRFSNLPVEIRYKGSRTARNHEDNIYKVFDSGVFATVAFNSIAAVESVLYGIPAFVSVPCAASPIASNDLSKLSNPEYPNEDTIFKQACNLSYGQFTIDEIKSGVACKIIEKYEK